MKKSLDLTLYHQDQLKIQEALNQLPALTDTTIWSEQYEVSPIVAAPALLAATGYTATAMVRFHDEASRESIYQAILNIQGVLIGFDVGTRIQKHDCNHDTGGPCSVEIVYEVV